MMDEKLIAFYKKHINWRFFNYLSDKTLKYEDLGCTVRLGICYDRGSKGKPLIYIKSPEANQFICGPDDIETTDFLYKISISTYLNKEAQIKNEFIESIKNKSIIISDDALAIYVKPNETI